MGKRGVVIRSRVVLSEITFEIDGDGYGSWQSVQAIYQGKQIGCLEMERTESDRECGELLRIQVQEEFRRQGVANALWAEALRLHVEEEDHLRPIHSAHRTDSGDAWARSFGVTLPERIPVENEDDY